jgi:hypothetical protein
MMDQQNFEAVRPASADPHLTAAPRHPASVESLARELGLKLGVQHELTIRRIRRGKTYSFVRANGTPVRHTGTINDAHLAEDDRKAERHQDVDRKQDQAGKALHDENGTKVTYRVVAEHRCPPSGKVPRRKHIRDAGVLSVE